ncbi:UbiA family prenyltransferase [Deinococcus sp. QL22]|uniref:UbiA family prenyltransferase n=1 Tax=Deinococcus sp. QL22 TaxID=2939437 RepID=UPI002016D7B2|nr:UbiA family prenyltransferase [Deinococcus sp. QL22]UQN08648.1 UbiA family prenyltransferase [Deinococcus sp. QL22]
MSSDAVGTPVVIRRLRGHLQLARISNSPTVASNVLAGAALGGSLTLGGATGFVVLAMVLLYTAGMYLNDILDYTLDVRERPGRPLPSGVVPRAEAAVVTTLLFAAGLGLLATVSSAALLGGTALAILIVVYDLWHKTNPISPLLMAGTRMLVYLIASWAFAPAVGNALLVWTVLLGAYIVGLTYIAKTERQTHLARYWPVALLALPAIYFALTLSAAPSLPGYGLLAGFLLWVAYSLTSLYNPRHRNVGRTVGNLIAGVSLLDALVLFHQRAPYELLLLALSAFVLTLFWQRFIKGT